MSRTLGNSFGPREASVEIVHTYPISFDTPGIGEGVGILVDVIHASTDNPVEIEVSVNVVTEFNGSGDNLFTVTGFLIIDQIASTIAAGYYPASNAVDKFRITSDTSVTVGYTDSASDATTGFAVVMIKEIVQNTLPVV